MDGYVPRLKAKYQEEIVPELMNQFEYANVMQVPRLVRSASIKVSAKLPPTRR